MLDNPTAPKSCTSIVPFNREVQSVALPKVILPTQPSFMDRDSFKQKLAQLFSVISRHAKN